MILTVSMLLISNPGKGSPSWSDRGTPGSFLWLMLFLRWDFSFYADSKSFYIKGYSHCNDYNVANAKLKSFGRTKSQAKFCSMVKDIKSKSKLSSDPCAQCLIQLWQSMMVVNLTQLDGLPVSMR